MNKKKKLNFKISLGTFVLLVILLISLIIISYIQNWDILGKLTSPQAFLGYMIFFLGGLVLVTETWKAKIMDGDDDED